MMNDNTILRIHVPAHLYESVKKKLTINEAKSDMSGGAYTEVVKEKKSPATPKAPTVPAPKAKAQPKDPAIPEEEAENIEMNEEAAPKMDVKKLKEFKAMIEMLIGKMEEGKKGSKEEEESEEEKDEE